MLISWVSSEVLPRDDFGTYLEISFIFRRVHTTEKVSRNLTSPDLWVVWKLLCRLWWQYDFTLTHLAYFSMVECIVHSHLWLEQSPRFLLVTHQARNAGFFWYFIHLVVGKTLWLFHCIFFRHTRLHFQLVDEGYRFYWVGSWNLCKIVIRKVGSEFIVLFIVPEWIGIVFI